MDAVPVESWTITPFGEGVVSVTGDQAMDRPVPLVRLIMLVIASALGVIASGTRVYSLTTTFRDNTSGSSTVSYTAWGTATVRTHAKDVVITYPAGPRYAVLFIVCVVALLWFTAQAFLRRRLGQSTYPALVGATAAVFGFLGVTACLIAVVVSVRYPARDGVGYALSVGPSVYFAAGASVVACSGALPGWPRTRERSPAAAEVSSIASST